METSNEEQKCPSCEGLGSRPQDVFGVPLDVKCKMCKGTGYSIARTETEAVRSGAGLGDREAARCNGCGTLRELRDYCGGHYCQPCIDWNESMMENTYE